MRHGEQIIYCPQVAAWCSRKPVGLPRLLRISFISWHQKQCLYTCVSAITFIKTGALLVIEKGLKNVNQELQNPSQNITIFTCITWYYGACDGSGVLETSNTAAGRRLSHSLLPQACVQHGCTPGMVPEWNSRMCTTQVCKAVPVFGCPG